MTRNVKAKHQSKRLTPRASRPRLPASFSSLQGAKQLLPWSWAHQRLVKAHNYFIVTVRPDGRPHMVPIWGCWIDNRFRFNTDRESVKAINLAANPKCVVSPEDASEAVLVEGVVREFKNPAAVRRFISLFALKYDWKLQAGEGAFYELKPDLVLGFSETADDFAASATRWTFGS
jgi:Pyridoxamine 5'-phosphate oxidase